MRETTIKRELEVGPDYVAQFFCPACEKVRRVDLSEGSKGRVNVEIRCACGNLFEVVISRRRYVRRDVSRPGSFFRKDAGDRKPMIVRSLSRGGLSLETSTPDELSVGDKVRVEFALWHDGPVVRKEVVIRRVERGFLGAEFLPSAPDDIYQKYCDAALAFYFIRAKPR